MDISTCKAWKTIAIFLLMLLSILLVMALYSLLRGNLRVEFQNHQLPYPNAWHGTPNAPLLGYGNQGQAGPGPLFPIGPYRGRRGRNPQYHDRDPEAVLDG